MFKYKLFYFVHMMTLMEPVLVTQDCLALGTSKQCVQVPTLEKAAGIIGGLPFAGLPS